MARIRTIKPGFWEDDVVASLTIPARLLFIATFNIADDEGLLRWSPDYLKAQAFIYDESVPPTKVGKMMAELVTSGVVFPYIAGRANQRLAFIVNFRKHQRINRPQPSQLPPPSLQNKDVVLMYARRDGWKCHLCKGPVNRTFEGIVDPYDPREGADPGSDPSPDHLVPRSRGGGDYPSNIGTSHLRCNKARRDDPLPHYPATDSVNDSVNDSAVTHGTITAGSGSGREGKGSTRPTESEDHQAQPEGGRSLTQDGYHHSVAGLAGVIRARGADL